MSTLYIDRKGINVKLENKALIFYENNKRIGTVPIAPLERIYIRGNITISSSLLGMLGQNGVGVIIMSGKKAKASLFLPRSHNDARTRFFQYKFASDTSKALELAQSIVYSKLKSQAKFLRNSIELRPDKRYYLTDASKKIMDLSKKAFEKEDISSLRGLEGSGASLYFSAYEHLLPSKAGFKGRNRRPPKDPVNACLSLSYTLLHAEAVIAAHGHGFDPYIGFLHEIDFARESLACDLVESLRSHMDYFVWRLFAEQHLRPTNFTKESNGVCFMGKAGREKFYSMVETPLKKARKELDITLKYLRNHITGVTENGK